jgi:hypothetical protein
MWLINMVSDRHSMLTVLEYCSSWYIQFLNKPRKHKQQKYFLVIAITTAINSMAYFKVHTT